MGQGYQDRDREIIDYQLYEAEGFPRPLRGPDPGDLETGRFIACLGAAQTFGPYVEQPYPALLGLELGLPALNLGVAGAGPSFFLTRRRFLQRANESALAVVQVMSGRSVSNSLLESKGGEMLTVRETGEQKGAAPAYLELLRSLERPALLDLVRETQERWVAETTELLQALRVPTVLLWFSTREPDYQPGFADERELMGDFPQFLQGWMLEAVRGHADACAECTSAEGLPQPLFSRHTGERATIRRREDAGGIQKAVNDYYPSPEMHRLAAEALLAPCRGLLAPR